MPFVCKVGGITRRRFLLTLAALGISTHSVLYAQSVGRQSSAARHLETLRAGGLVLYFRHPPTTWSGVDHIDWPRERQRLLSAEGLELARTVGDVFKRHQLRVGEVLASPFARCRDMAEIAFGRVEERRELLGLLSQDSERQQRIAYSLELLRRPLKGNKLRIIVGHSSNIRASAGVYLSEGSAAIVRPGGDPAGFEVLDIIEPDEWRAPAGY